MYVQIARRTLRHKLPVTFAMRLRRDEMDYTHGDIDNVSNATDTLFAQLLADHERGQSLVEADDHGRVEDEDEQDVSEADDSIDLLSQESRFDRVFRGLIQQHYSNIELLQQHDANAGLEFMGTVTLQGRGKVMRQYAPPEYDWKCCHEMCWTHTSGQQINAFRQEVFTNGAKTGGASSVNIRGEAGTGPPDMLQRVD
jgi:hypothetical protein